LDTIIHPMTKHAHEFAITDFPPDTKAADWLTIAPRADGGDWRLPLLVVRGARPGATLVVTAGVHGDEYEGIEAIAQLFAALQPAELAGTLVMVPVCNMPAYEAAQRSSPIDGLNLARVFPGDANGTITQRIAYWITEKLLNAADFYIDLHSGGVAYNIPTLIGYIRDEGPLGQASLAGARAFGAPVLWGHPLPVAPGRTVSAATDLGVPSLYSEAPAGGYARPEDVACFRQGVINVMRHLGMLAGDPQPQPMTHHLFGDGDLDSVLTAAAAGYFRAEVDLLTPVQPGQRLGVVQDFAGQIVQEVRADQAGVVIMLRRLHRVHVGDGLAHVTGVIDDRG
jgi:predicted deacylase